MGAYNEYDDIVLVQLFKLNNDQLAYTEIFERYSTLLYAHAYNKLRDQFEAEDVVQEVFSKLWLKREILDIHANLASYLFVIARNLVIDKIRQRQVITTFEKKYTEQLSKSVEDADSLVREKQFNELIEREISLLPPRMRLVFELRRNHQLSNKEISLELGIAESTVEGQMKKALKILRSKLKWVQSLSNLFFSILPFLIMLIITYFFL